LLARTQVAVLACDELLGLKPGVTATSTASNARFALVVAMEGLGNCFEPCSPHSPASFMGVAYKIPLNNGTIRKSLLDSLTRPHFRTDIFAPLELKP
jgi:hypothetical protein